MDSAAQKLATYFRQSQTGVVFTGAGKSTESGIPDFRSPGGLWTKFKPIEFSDFLSSEEMRIEAWRRKFGMDDSLGKAEPNAGHKAIARLIALGKLSGVITQNIDNLHQDSGAQPVVELHGNATYAKCLSCERRYEMKDIKSAFLKTEKAPTCSSCGGIVKSATISFGQAMPEVEMKLAEELTTACDLFLAIGSSLQVYPAAGFPVMAKRLGAKLIILNREPTPLDDIADLVIHDEIGKVLSEVTALLNN
jgi:NAD-dependent deacetylase